MKMQIQPGRKVQVGFIGAGSVAQVHQAALEKCESAHVAAVYDIDPDRANALATTTATRVCRTADELVRLCNRPQPIWNLPAYWDTFLEEDRYFIEQCLLGGKRPLSTLEDVLTCLDILNAAEESIESGTVKPLL